MNYIKLFSRRMSFMKFSINSSKVFLFPSKIIILPSSHFYSRASPYSILPSNIFYIENKDILTQAVQLILFSIKHFAYADSVLFFV